MIVSLNSKQKILNITGPDALTKAINKCIETTGALHRNIDYMHFFERTNMNYQKMYAINNKKHYSQYNEPLYLH